MTGGGNRMEDLFMGHQELRRTLTLWDGIALAIGSIAGSGILYLPSLTYVLAGYDVLLVWLGGTLLCLPLLFMFTDMVQLIPANAPGTILSGVVVTFWAYVGFENMTFVAGEFRHPRRDFPLAMIIGFLVYGGLAVALTVIIAALIPRNHVSDLSGLFQLAQRLTPAWLATGIIVAFALAIMQLNAASWLWGMSRLLYASARAKRLPGWFAHLDSRGLPRRAILSLGILFAIMTGLTAVFPNVLVSVFTVASSVFLFLYLLCIASYLRVTQSSGKRLVYAFLLATLVSIGLKILYPIAVFLLALLTSIVRERRVVSHPRKEEEKVCQ
jgi:amino acid efflux transporter